MNKARRQSITNVVTGLHEFAGLLESLKDEEQEYYDNMPEGFQNGDKGEQAQAAIDALDQACDNLQNTIDSLEDAAGQ